VEGPKKSWNLLGSDVDGGHNDVDADAKICMSTHLFDLYSILYLWVLQPLFTVHLGKRVQLLCAVYSGTIRSINSTKVTAICL